MCVPSSLLTGQSLHLQVSFIALIVLITIRPAIDSDKLGKQVECLNSAQSIEQYWQY